MSKGVTNAVTIPVKTYTSISKNILLSIPDNALWVLSANPVTISGQGIYGFTVMGCGIKTSSRAPTPLNQVECWGSYANNSFNPVAISGMSIKDTSILIWYRSANNSMASFEMAYNSQPFVLTVFGGGGTLTS